MAGPVCLDEDGTAQSDRFIDLIPPKPVLRLRRLLHLRKSSGGILRSQAGRERGPTIVLIMARVRLNGETSLINSLISNLKLCRSRAGGSIIVHQNRVG